jgi:glycine C-acetyltransferase
VGTLSKAFGVVGGYVAGNMKVIDYLRQKARPFLFSSATPAADVAACIAAVDILESGSGLVEKLWENARPVQTLKLGSTSDAPDAHHTRHRRYGSARESLAGFSRRAFAQAIGFPTVPEGKARYAAWCPLRIRRRTGLCGGEV